MSTLKTVVYRGGLVSFRIPAHWQETTEADGAGAYFDPATDRRNLFLRVITAQAEQLPDAAYITDLVGRLATNTATAHGGSKPDVEALPAGNAVGHFVYAFVEDGRPAHANVWVLAGGFAPNNVRVAQFNYVYDAESADDPAVADELLAVDAAVRGAVFGR